MPGLLGPQPQQGLLGQSVMDPNYQPPSQMRGLLGGAVRGVMDVLPLGDAMGGIRTNPFIKMVAQKLGIPLETASELVDKHMKPQGSQFDPNYRTANSAYEFGRAAVNAAPGAAYQMANAAPTKSTPQFTINQDGQIVWHGSPHKFDRFDASKIGTGEGAQAYGHGLYLAESPGVAGSYQEKLSGVVPTEIAANGRVFDFKDAAAQAWGEEASKALIASGAANKREAWDAIADALRAKGIKDARAISGNLYKVDLPDSAIAKMLDWDKPLSQQPKAVQAALQSLVGDVTGGGFDLTRAPRNVRNAFDSSALQAAESALASKYGATKTPTGWLDKSGKPIPQDSVDKMLAKLGGKSYENAGQLYNDLAHIVGSQPDVSATLRNLGVPGIQYLDGGSRAAGIGTKNFVVFPGNESLLQILERNGVPLK